MYSSLNNPMFAIVRTQFTSAKDNHTLLLQVLYESDREHSVMFRYGARKAADHTCMMRSKLKAPSFHSVNSPLLLPVIQRVVPSGAQDTTLTGLRCLFTLALIKLVQMLVEGLSVIAEGGSILRV
jgi:hypothetical protein